METTLKMTPETIETNWAEVGKILAVVLPIFAAVWHYINKLFKDKADSRAALISEVAEKTATETVKKAISQYISPLEKQIEKMSSEIKDGLKQVNERIDHALENRK